MVVAPGYLRVRCWDCLGEGGGSTRWLYDVSIIIRVVLFRGPNDVLNSNPTLQGEPVDWNSPEGEALLKLLPPSADIVNFRIAHEVVHMMKHDWVWGALLSPVMLVAGYHLAVFLCKSMLVPVNLASHQVICLLVSVCQLYLLQVLL